MQKRKVMGLLMAVNNAAEECNRENEDEEDGKKFDKRVTSEFRPSEPIDESGRKDEADN